MPRSYSKPDEEESVEGLGAGTYAANAATMGGAGALAGSTFGPPGTLIGGALGVVAGLGKTALDNKSYKDAQKQQLAMQADIEGAGADFDRFLGAEGLANAQARSEAALSAQQASARAGLTPGAAVALEQQAVQDVSRRAQMGRGELFTAGMQQSRAERQQIMSEYTTAQNLANAAPTPGDQFGQAFGAATQAAAAYGKAISAEEAAAAEKAAAAADAAAKLAEPTAGGIGTEPTQVEFGGQADAQRYATNRKAAFEDGSLEQDPNFLGTFDEFGNPMMLSPASPWHTDMTQTEAPQVVSQGGPNPVTPYGSPPPQQPAGQAQQPAPAQAGPAGKGAVSTPAGSLIPRLPQSSGALTGPVAGQEEAQGPGVTSGVPHVSPETTAVGQPTVQAAVTTETEPIQPRISPTGTEAERLSEVRQSRLAQEAAAQTAAEQIPARQVGQRTEAIQQATFGEEFSVPGGAAVGAERTVQEKILAEQTPGTRLWMVDFAQNTEKQSQVRNNPDIQKFISEAEDEEVVNNIVDFLLEDYSRLSSGKE